MKPQPIATAPRNGKRIMAFNVETRNWHFAAWVEDDDDVPDWPFTHWMEAPPAPQPNMSWSERLVYWPFPRRPGVNGAIQMGFFTLVVMIAVAAVAIKELCR